MCKLFLSVRITKNFFTPDEISKIRKELKFFNNKSDFVREAIKNYLKKDNSSYSNNMKEIKEIKQIIKKNQTILKEIKENKNKSSYKSSKTYTAEEQKIKTEQALNLLDQF